MPEKKSDLPRPVKRLSQQFGATLAGAGRDWGWEAAGSTSSLGSVLTSIPPLSGLNLLIWPLREREEQAVHLREL